MNARCTVMDMQISPLVGQIDVNNSIRSFVAFTVVAVCHFSGVVHFRECDGYLAASGLFGSR